MIVRFEYALRRNTKWRHMALHYVLVDGDGCLGQIRRHDDFALSCRGTVKDQALRRCRHLYMQCNGRYVRM
jgi:hypothetical protein